MASAAVTGRAGRTEVPPRVVLCGTDFSPPSDRACDAAALLARRFDAHVIVVHVVARAAELPFSGDRLLRYAAARLPGVPVTNLVAVGDPAHELARLARQEGADLVLIGHSRGAAP